MIPELAEKKEPGVDSVIEEVMQILKGRDIRDPHDAAILVECLSVVIDHKISRLVNPVTLEAALAIIAAEEDPDYIDHRRHWCAYLRTMPKDITTPMVGRS